ncbi:MAG: hypothetical protein ACW98K_07085 [Candidatus Kariarchaeaceae archaeon]|jgi:hypothetical protein
MSQYLKDQKYALLDIERTIEKVNWVSSYEVFLQAIDRITSASWYPVGFEMDRKRIDGVAIRLISKNKKMKEISLGLSSLSKLSSISEPKSTVVDTQIRSFAPLKPPRISSIQRDEGSSIFLTKELVNDLLSKIVESRSPDDLTLHHSIRLQKENITLINLGSKPLENASFKLQYTIHARKQVSGNSFSTNRTVASRNLNVNFDETITQAIVSTRNQTLPSYRVADEIKSVIFHPEVIGRIIAYQSTNHK